MTPTEIPPSLAKETQSVVTNPKEKRHCLDAFPVSDGSNTTRWCNGERKMMRHNCWSTQVIQRRTRSDLPVAPCAIMYRISPGCPPHA